MSYMDNDMSEQTRVESDPVEKEKSTFQEVTMPPMPETIDFAGEILPLEKDDVKERFEREMIRNSFFHSSTIMYLKRANRFFPIIEPILAKHGIPDDFKYLAVAESALDNPTSPAGAKGMWQFLSGTAKEYGLEVSSQVDERYDYEKSTEAACKYIKYLHNRFDSWTLAAAAYNMGPNGLSKALRNQSEDNYHNLNVNSETSRYIHRIASIKQIMQNPELYGFFLKDAEKYAPYKSTILVQVDTSIPSLGVWAHNHGLSYRELKIYNPWLRDGSLDLKTGKKYLIRIPKSN